MAIINATNEAAKKQKNDVFTGTAEIVEVSAVDARWTDGLSEEEAASAFDIEIRVKPDDASVGEHVMYIPFTKRVPKFEKSGRTEADIAIDDLSKQGLVENGDISTVLTAQGKKCQVWIYDEVSAKGTYRRCVLSRARPKLSQADVLKKLAMMTANAPKAAPAAPAASRVNPFV